MKKITLSTIAHLLILSNLCLLYSCKKEDLIFDSNRLETSIAERSYRFVDYETLRFNIGESMAFKSNIQFFQRLDYAAKGVDFVNAYIDVNTIHLIETEFTNFYTLRIINNNPKEKGNAFYNIVFEQNLRTGEVTSEILHYNPDIEWLLDKTQSFKGEILKFDNQLISLDDLTNNFNANIPKGINPCTISAELVWVCTVNNHPPGVEGCGGSWMWVLTIGPGCGNGGGGGGGNGGGYDPGDGGGGGGGSSNGSGSTQTVTLEICNGYTNTGEPGDSEDCEDDYAAYFTPYICEDYVDFPLINSINNWAPGNMGAATALANYLANNFPEDDDDNCAEVDFVDKVIKDSSFKDTDTECIHEKMKSNPNSIYSKMFEHFNGTTGKFLHLKVGNTPKGDWGITRGNDANAQSYTLTVDNNVNANGSNLMKYVTLCHEMIHAYMWSVLEDKGLIDFDSSGLPSITFGCEGYIPNLNAISIEDRFVEVICALQAAGNYNAQWTHELFNKNVFEIEDYRQALEDFLKNEYDWNSESQSFRTEAQNVFGSNWKQEVARAVSWIGLEKTNNFLDYIASFGFNIQKINFAQNIKIKIATLNKNCS